MAKPRLKAGYWKTEFAKIRRLDHVARKRRGSNSPEHYKRARTYVDTEAFTGKTGERHTEIAYGAAHKYLDTREGITPSIAKELQYKTATEAATRMVMDELITLDMHPKECAEVLRGIDIGKIALRETSLP